MSLINKLREKSNKEEQTKQEIIDEIKMYFCKYFETTTKLEQYVEMVSNHYIKERKIPLVIEFWKHHEGCSETHFFSGGCKWENKEDKYSGYYKGFYLKDLQYEICEYIKVLAKDNMIKLGFKFIGEERKESWLGYYKVYLWFSW